MRKYAILGGTFDPIHYGHISLAQAALNAGSVDRVLLMPSGRPPKKTALASAQDRLAMTMLAAYGLPGVEVSALESTALCMSYTVDTLQRLSSTYTDTRLYLLLGSDALPMLPMWKNASKLIGCCSGILCAQRDGDASSEAAIARIRNALGLSVTRLPMESYTVSSSEIRQAAAARADLTAMTPVSEYIVQHALYGAGFCGMSQALRNTMSVSRFQHTLSVATTAICLAYVHHEPPDKAHLAGMLHDCAKGLRYEEQTQWIARGNIEVDEEERAIPSICHAPAGVALAKQQYGVTDEDILSAIRWHTTGRVGMTRLDKIIYLADMIEPLRRPFPGLSHIRQLAYRDLDSAVMLAAKTSADHIQSSGRKLLRRTLELLQDGSSQTV